MTQLRYGPRPTASQDDREVKATKIGAWSTSLTATFLTDPEVVAAVLPPPLEPPDEPTVKVSISRVDLGGDRPPFGAGTFAVAARHGDTEGFYPLLMPMTSEQAVIGGAFEPELLHSAERANGVANHVAERLDAVSEETERGWSGRFACASERPMCMSMANIWSNRRWHRQSRQSWKPISTCPAGRRI